MEGHSPDALFVRSKGLEYLSSLSIPNPHCAAAGGCTFAVRADRQSPTRVGALEGEEIPMPKTLTVEVMPFKAAQVSFSWLGAELLQQFPHALAIALITARIQCVLCQVHERRVPAALEL